MNRFGDAFVVTEDGAVSMLDVGAGSFERLADNRDHFSELLDVDNNANVWLMIPLIDECVAAGMTLAAHQCYGFKIPPVLGGKYQIDVFPASQLRNKYQIDNVEPTDLAVHYGLLADIYRQTKDLPDGTPIDAVIAD